MGLFSGSLSGKIGALLGDAKRRGYSVYQDVTISINKLDKWYEYSANIQTGDACTTSVNGYFSLYSSGKHKSLNEALNDLTKQVSVAASKYPSIRFYRSLEFATESAALQYYNMEDATASVEWLDSNLHSDWRSRGISVFEAYSNGSWRPSDLPEPIGILDL